MESNRAIARNEAVKFKREDSESISESSSFLTSSESESEVISDHEDYENADNILCQSLRVSDSSEETMRELKVKENPQFLMVNKEDLRYAKRPLSDR